MKTRNSKKSTANSQFEVLNNNEMRSVYGGDGVLLMHKAIDENGKVVVIIEPIN